MQRDDLGYEKDFSIYFWYYSFKSYEYERIVFTYWDVIIKKKLLRKKIKIFMVDFLEIMRLSI